MTPSPWDAITATFSQSARPSPVQHTCLTFQNTSTMETIVTQYWRVTQKCFWDLWKASEMYVISSTHSQHMTLHIGSPHPCSPHCTQRIAAPHPQPSGRLKCVGTTTALGTVNWVDISDRYIFWWIMARRHYSPCSRCDCPLSGQCSQVEDTNCTGNYTPPPPLLPVLCTVQCTGQYCTGETSHAGTGRQ